MPDADAPDTAPPAAPDATTTLEFLLRRMRHKSDFPALGGAVARIQTLTDSEHETLDRLSEEILKDVALTQKLLRMVNTAHYRRAGGGAISTISRAVSLIGFAGIRNLALSLVLVEHMQDKHHAQQLKEAFLRAVMAGTLADELCPWSRDSEEAFISALFRNLGRLLAEFYLPEDAEDVRQRVHPKGNEPPVPEEAAAAEVLGLGYQALGQAVGANWGLPETMLRAMQRPDTEPPKQSVAQSPDRLRWLASLANEMADAMLYAEPSKLEAELQAAARRYQKGLGIDPVVAQEAAGRAKRRLTELTRALDLQISPQSSAERLIDTFYVDAPNAGGTEGPSAEALGLETPEILGQLGEGKLPPPQDKAGMLTAGIQDITNAMVDSFKLNDVLHMILETMFRALGLRRVIFCMRDAKGTMLQGRFGLGEGVEQLKPAFQVPLKPGPKGEIDLFTAVCLKNADTLIADASAPAIVARLPVFFRDRVQAPTFLLLPLMMKHQGKDLVIGLIYADQAKVNGLQISDSELSLLRTLRNQAVMAFKQVTNQ